VQQHVAGARHQAAGEARFDEAASENDGRVARRVAVARPLDLMVRQRFHAEGHGAIAMTGQRRHAVGTRRDAKIVTRRALPGQNHALRTSALLPHTASMSRED
jgi:hypothetical protein